MNSNKPQIGMTDFMAGIEAADAKDLHSRAMDIAYLADVAKRQKRFDESQDLYKQAYYIERLVAIRSALLGIGEPSESVLLCSAASLALECGRLHDCQRLAKFALSRTPPDEIAEELRDMIEEVNHKLNTK